MVSFLGSCTVFASYCCMLLDGKGRKASKSSGSGFYSKPSKVNCLMCGKHRV